jgi:hypothetical protein
MITNPDSRQVQDLVSERGGQVAQSAARQRKPVHERIRWLGWLRRKARSRLFKLLRALAATDDAKAIQVATLRSLLPGRPVLAGVRPDDQPYANLGRAAPRSTAACRQDVVFITARFRTGSTLLWNLFRKLDGCTAYYEPLNERRWFDPAARGSYTDRTHRGVDNYWREYQGLEILGRYYDERWIDHDLLMDADSWNPAMKQFVELLIARAPGRPVLQFNRVDFRLPWLRHNFPGSKIVHLYRHPRDQWCSTLSGPQSCPAGATMAEFGPHDHYYLGNWARDLKYHFPFLDEDLIEHPYQMFYFIWKLSYLFGRGYAHHSLAFEDLVNDPRKTLTDLFRALGVEGADLDTLAGLIDKPKTDRWKDFAPEAWFQDHEASCEAVIAEFLARRPAPPPNPRAEPRKVQRVSPARQ